MASAGANCHDFSYRNALKSCALLWKLSCRTLSVSMPHLSILRLLGALREQEPPFGHFDEKRLMRRCASFLCQSNALSSIQAQLI